MYALYYYILKLIFYNNYYIELKAKKENKLKKKKKKLKKQKKIKRKRQLNKKSLKNLY